MGGGNGMGEGMERSLMASMNASSIPPSLLQALRALDQELGEDTEREALEGVVDGLVEWFLGESKTPRTADGDDLGLCLRAVRWLAPRFHALSSSSDLQRSAAAEAATAAAAAAAATADGIAAAAGNTRGGFRGEEAAATEGAERARTTTPEAQCEEPLQLLLELGAGHLGAGVDGIHESLSLMAGALSGGTSDGGHRGGLKSMRLRRAFASALRAHLATVQVDSVFRFDAPRNLAAAGGSGGAGGGGGGGEMLSPGRLALPPMLNWASFRKYTTTMWVRLDPAGGGGAATLFRFRNGEGVGVEATLSAAGAPTEAAAAAAAAGAGGGGGGGKGQQQLQGRREIVVTSFQRLNKGFSVRCKFGPPAEVVQLAGTGQGVRQGGWRFVAVSHGQPYVKRSGRLRVSVDGDVVLDTELPYPAVSGHGSKDPMSRCCFCEGFVGEAAALALYEDELDMAAVRALLAAGPNHLGAAQPLPVATSDTLPPLLHTQMLSGQGADTAASARLVAAFLPRMCMDDGVCPAWRPGGTVDLHDVVMSRSVGWVEES
ncbi:unnamed protein product [Hapterophycus canaliculatus]